MQSQAQGTSNHGPIGPSNLSGQAQQTGSGSLQRNIDLNASSENNEPQLSLDLLRTGTSLGNSQNPISGGPSSPVMIHSGSAGYVVEENTNRDGLPTHGQTRLLCKRRASEVQPQLQNNIVNNSNVASSSNNGTHSTGPVVAPPTQIGQVDNFQRFTRLRTTVSQQNPSSMNVSALNSSNYNIVQVQQQQQQQAIGHQRPPTFFSPFGPFPMATSPQMPVMANAPMFSPPPQQPIVGVPSQLQAPPLQSQYWNGQPMSPFSPSHFMIPTPPNMQPNLNLVNGNQSFLGREALMQPPSPFSSVRYPSYPTTLEQYTQRLQYDVGPYFPPHAGASPIVRDMEISMRGGNPRPGQFRSGAIVERQATQRSPLSRTVQSQLTAQRRRRLVTQIRNYLRLVRRTGSYRLEDALLVGRSILNGMHLLEDTSELDERLDVDNMSYEELLDLEEQIGDVSTGLSEETILANLRRRKYQPIVIQPPAEPEPCCICQEDYANGEELGKLDCGHDFHFSCIKQWLVQKNLCPVCKKTALAI